MKKKQLGSHAAQVNNLGGVIENLKTYGDSYQPGNPNLSIANLEAAYASGTQCIQDILNLEAQYSALSTQMKEQYHVLNKRLTQVLAYLKSAAVKENIIEDIEQVIRRIYPIRNQSKKSKTETRDPENNKTYTTHITPEVKVNEFSKVLELLSGIETYTPNEEELSKSGLKAFYDTLLQLNMDLRVTTATLEKARLQRDRVLYHPETGISSLGRMVKFYARSAYGINSAESKKLSEFRFIKVKN